MGFFGSCPRSSTKYHGCLDLFQFPDLPLPLCFNYSSPLFVSLCSLSSSFATSPPHLARGCAGVVGSDLSVRRVSLPDIPLTPREQEILVQTSDLGGSYDNVDADAARALTASDTVFTFDHDHDPDPQANSAPGAPPPKPPLPAGANNILPKYALTD